MLYGLWWQVKMPSQSRAWLQSLQVSLIPPAWPVKKVESQYVATTGRSTHARQMNHKEVIARSASNVLYKHPDLTQSFQTDVLRGGSSIILTGSFMRALKLNSWDWTQVWTLLIRAQNWAMLAWWDWTLGLPEVLIEIQTRQTNKALIKTNPYYLKQTSISWVV